MNRFVDELLSFKNESYTKSYKKAADKKDPLQYMESGLFLFVMKEKNQY